MILFTVLSVQQMDIITNAGQLEKTGESADKHGTFCITISAVGKKFNKPKGRSHFLNHTLERKQTKQVHGLMTTATCSPPG